MPAKKKRPPPPTKPALSPRAKKPRVEARPNNLMAPCSIRQDTEQPFPEGQTLNLTNLLARHLLAKNGAHIKLQFQPAAVRAQINLPMLLDLSNTNARHAGQNEYVAAGLVRDVVPSAEFEEKFKETGFVPTQSILLVPILTDEEEDAWKTDEATFMTTMCTPEWLSDGKRTFWVCDGATRYTLSKKFDMALFAMFLRPDICELSASTIASGHNEGATHMNNATLLISKLQTVGRLSYAGYTHEQIMVSNK